MSRQGSAVQAGRQAGRVAASVLVIVIAAAMLLPFWLMISTSLKTANEVASPTFQWLPRSLRYQNYVSVLTERQWGRFFFNSVFVTAVTTVVGLLFNSMGGFAFARLRFRGRNALFLALMVGLLVPPQITMVPVFIIMKNIPLFGGNNIIGQGGTGWINTYWGLMMPYLAGAFGVFLSRQFYLTFPASLDDAADMDGAGRFRTYFSLYLPLSGPLLASLGVVKATYTWNEYVWPLVIIHSEQLKTLQLALADFRSDAIQWERMMAATTVVILPMVVLFLFAQKSFVRGIVTSGIKG